MAHFKSLWHICTNRWNLTLRSWLAVFFILTQSDIRYRWSDVRPVSPHPPSLLVKKQNRGKGWTITTKLLWQSFKKMQVPFYGGGVRPAIKHETDFLDSNFFSLFCLLPEWGGPEIFIWQQSRGCISLSREGGASRGECPVSCSKSKVMYLRATEERGWTMWWVANLVINFRITAILLQIFCYKYLWESHCKVHIFFFQFPFRC